MEGDWNRTAITVVSGREDNQDSFVFGVTLLCLRDGGYHFLPFQLWGGGGRWMTFVLAFFLTQADENVSIQIQKWGRFPQVPTQETW